MSVDDYKFISILKRYGIKRILTSKDIWVSAILSLIILIVLIHSAEIKLIFKDIFTTLIAISAAMVATSMAGLAIVTSMSDENFIKFLKQGKVGKNSLYINILFPFWYSTVISGMAIVSDVLTYAAIYEITGFMQVLYALAGISFFLFLYSITIVIGLVGTTLRYGIYRAEFIDI